MVENTEKRICLIVPDLQKGGMERVMSELANYFSGKVLTKVFIILFKYQSGVFYKIPDNVSVIKPNFLFNNRIRLVSTVRTLIFFRRTIQRINPNAVLSFGETYNSFVLLSCLFMDINVFVSDRSKPDKKWGFLHENLRRILYPKAAGIIAQTNYSKDFLKKEIGHNNIIVIANPVRDIKENTVERSNVILNVGRLFKSKRLDLLLNIFSKCENEGWELWLVGEGDDEETDRLKRMTIELNIFDRVKFWGKQENIENFYRTAKIFAFTSESEGLPNVLLEAMAAGLSCISFNCIAGPGDLIKDNEDGYLVELYDCESYISKLNSLIRSHSLREKFSKNAVKKSKEFDINIIGERFYNFLLS